MAKKTWVTIVGWLLVVVGVAAIPLPGPGLLILLSGLVVLSQEYEWAEKRVEPVRKKAIEGAKDSVATYPRIVAGSDLRHGHPRGRSLGLVRPTPCRRSGSSGPGFRSGWVAGRPARRSSSPA